MDQEPHPKAEKESMFRLLASKPPRRGKREAATLVTSLVLHGAVAAGLAVFVCVGVAAAYWPAQRAAAMDPVEALRHE